MIADFRYVHSKVIFSGSGHKLAAGFQKIDKFRRGHTRRRARIEPFILAETPDNLIYELLFRRITVSLHHVEYFVSMYHIRIVLLFPVLFGDTLS